MPAEGGTHSSPPYHKRAAVRRGPGTLFVLRCGVGRQGGGWQGSSQYDGRPLGWWGGLGRHGEAAAGRSPQPANLAGQSRSAHCCALGGHHGLCPALHVARGCAPRLLYRKAPQHPLQ
eukprot:scaffold1837_cov391-Prasinococcus_capsulatus_cf.AAC.7